MAYINQETKAKLSPAIKAVLNKYGMKGSISLRHNMCLVVTIQSGKLDIIQNWYDTGTPVTRHTEEKVDYLTINRHSIDTSFSGKVAAFLNELYTAMKGNIWFDKSDIMTDYFHTAYYMDVYIGKYNKPFIVTP